MELTALEILTELKCFYTSKQIGEYACLSEQTITKIFNNKVIKCNKLTYTKLYQMFIKHVEETSIYETIPNLIKDSTASFLIETPDGFQKINKFFTKAIQPCFLIETTNSEISIKCSAEHLIQIFDESWILTKDITPGSKLLTKCGELEVKSITPLENQAVYDLEVSHQNHRYWAGGISSHNTGKSYIIIKTLANAQKLGLTPVIFDSENAIDATTAKNLGLDGSKCKYVPCFSIEQTRNSIYKFLTKAKEQGVSDKFIIAIDSLGNLQNELSLSRMEKENTSTDMGSRARSIKTLLNTCTNLSTTTKTTFILSNHLYDNPAEMYESIIKVQPGGKSVTYLPSVTVQLARKPEKSDEGKTMDGTLTVGQRNYPGAILRALTVKNRFIQQYLQVEMYLSFQTGLDKYYGLFDLAVGFGIVKQNGSTYTLANGEKLGYYKNFRKDEKFWDTILPELEKSIKEKWSYGSPAVIESLPDEGEVEVESIK